MSASAGIPQRAHSPQLAAGLASGLKASKEANDFAYVTGLYVMFFFFKDRRIPRCLQRGAFNLQQHIPGRPLPAADQAHVTDPSALSTAISARVRCMPFANVLPASTALRQHR